MGTRNEAIEVLAEHLDQPLSGVQERDAFCAKFEIKPFKEGWLFQAHASKKELNPLWWMVVNDGVQGFLFFKMANPRAYALAKQQSEALV